MGILHVFSGQCSPTTRFFLLIRFSWIQYQDIRNLQFISCQNNLSKPLKERTGVVPGTRMVQLFCIWVHGQGRPQVSWGRFWGAL